MINVQNAKMYCKEDISNIENYEEALNDQTQMWECHHILGEILTKEQLEAHDFYNNVPACMLKFVTKFEHDSIHGKLRTGEKSPMYGKHHTEETRKKMSDKAKGRQPWNKGKHHTEETRKKISQKSKGRKSALGKSWQTSKFGKGFYEHYNIRRADNIKLYDKEKYYFYKYGKFSWEVK